MTNTPSTPKKPNTPYDWEAIARYLSGESSPEESEQIAHWLGEHPSDAALVAALDKAMASLTLRDTSGIDVEAALRDVTIRRDARMMVTRRRTRQTPATLRAFQTVPSPWRTISILAAAAVVILAARAVLQKNGGFGALPPVAADSTRTYATAVGKRDSVRLPDGGHVVLGPASRLVVAAGYGKRVREVELHGEAYFEVVHDTTHPFVVRAGAATIRDIGTSFAVRNDSGARVQVVVTSGSVSLSSGVGRDSAVVLTPGDVGVIHPDGRVTAAHGASTSLYLAWMRDSLVFREAPISEVSSDLRRWYGVVLRVEDSSLAQRLLTMTFAGDPLDRVLGTIGLELGAHVERRGDSAIVRSARTQ